VNGLLFPKGIFPEKLLRSTVDYILQQQLSDGNIPWFEGGKTDPRDHTEAAMGLAIGGECHAAEKAYEWLAQSQLQDGSWWSNYQGNEPLSREQRETNFIAYVATGIWHQYLITQDRHFLQRFFPMVKSAIDFVLQYQSTTGEIYWAVDSNGKAKQDALITGCSSIYKSLECAINIARTLHEDIPHWVNARERLGTTLRHHPECFDRTWESKARYSMDWFYPILTGVLTGSDAKARINAKWSTFIEPNLGCRCVSDEPWVTVAESCELTMSLLAAGEHARAVSVYSWLHQFLDDDGGYWTGYVFPDKAIWPEEKTTWTAGAILLAADALTEHTTAAKLFTQTQLITEFEAQVSGGESTSAQNSQRIHCRQRFK
jgi:hypothetical protein